IGENAFCAISGLTSINIPESVTAIGDGAFSFCFDLTGDLTIPNSVKTIGSGAFFQCEGFNGTLTIGENVTYIGDEAFRKCSHFSKAVSLATNPPELGTEQNGMAFSEFGTQTLNVPYGCATAYQKSSWYDPIGLNGFYEFIEAELMRGDVNCDGSVNIADVTALIDILLSGTTASPAADCDEDDKVNIADVTALINYLLTGSW
ncbi:MAG: leucine-rich repeat protein, partial [Muribaculaceae bacterium]|nr:leucine-rich repeat protein [Muribaculaceae bacterium]